MRNLRDIIRKAEEEKGLFPSKVAAEMVVDLAIVRKTEWFNVKPAKDNASNLATLYQRGKNKLMVDWFSERVAYDLKNENLAGKMLKIEEQII